MTVGAGTEVTGNVTTRSGTVRIGPGVGVRGDISGDYVEVHHDATVEGAIRARDEMSMVSEPVLDDEVVGGKRPSPSASVDGEGSSPSADVDPVPGHGKSVAAGSNREPTPAITRTDRSGGGQTADTDDDGKATGPEAGTPE